MATLMHAESRRLYSWWWDSHISPKNSKWLKENLTDMDSKIKAMIKLIEEDADSFARRAEMYYKKRPELMKLVEEFYRAYRALAERYDHATVELRQAHRTMSEAFPNQVPLLLPEESQSGSSTHDVEPHTPEMPHPIRALLDPDDLLDMIGLNTSEINAIKKGKPYSEDSDAETGKRGLKQLNDMFGIRENLKFAEESMSISNENHSLKNKILSESERAGKAEIEVQSLKKTLSDLQAEKEIVVLELQQSLEKITNLEEELNRAQTDFRGLDEQANKAKSEFQLLKEALVKLEAEKHAASIRNKECLERISNMEYMLSVAHEDAKGVNERAIKAEIETEYLKKEICRLESEKEAGLLQYKQCLANISDLESKLSLANDEARLLKERANKAETEVKKLGKALAEQNEQKEAAALQYNRCLEKISTLESEISCAQADITRLNSEILMGVEKLKNAEEKHALLETSNQSLQLEAENFVRKIAMKDQEILEKHEELEKLQTCLQHEHLRFTEVENTLQILQNLHSQSQDDQRALTLELENGIQMINNLEICKNGLEEELEKAKDENRCLSELNSSSSTSMKNLEDEIFSLREMKERLEEAVALQMNLSNDLQEEINQLKEEITTMNMRYRALIEQLESVGLNPKCIESSVKGLQVENLKLREISERDRVEKEALFEKLENMDKLLETNTHLKSLFSEVSGELEVSQEKIKELQESTNVLVKDKSALVAEKSALLSQLHNATANMLKLLEKNTALECSLSGANNEIEGLRKKSKSLEDICELLNNEKSDLLTERGSLVIQLENVEHKLEHLERRFAELEIKHAGLKKEKEATSCEIEELRFSLGVEKQERANTVLSNDSRMANLENHIRNLQEESRWRRKECEEEFIKVMNAQFEIFILKKFIQDVEEKNYSLLIECQKHVEASRLTEKLILELEKENLEQHVEVEDLLVEVEKLRMGICQVFKVLEIGTCEEKFENEQILIHHIVRIIEEMKFSLSNYKDEKQQLCIENSVLLTLVEQLGQEGLEIESEHKILDQNFEILAHELVLVQDEKNRLLEANNQLRSDVGKGNQKVNLLEAEIERLDLKIEDLQRPYLELQEAYSMVSRENGSLLKKLSDLKEDKGLLEEENDAILLEMLAVGNLSVVFKSCVTEEGAKLKALSEEMRNLHGFNSDLENELSTIKDILDTKETKNILLQDSVEKLYKELDQVRDINGQLMKEKSRKEIELSEAEETLKAKEKLNIELNRTVEGLKRDCVESKLLSENLEKQILELSENSMCQNKDITFLEEVNKNLASEIDTLNGEIEERRIREESLSLELRERSNEFELWEDEAATFYFDLQISAVREALFEDKVHELAEVCVSLEDESCTKTVEIEQMRERVGSMEGEIGGLKAQLLTYAPSTVSLAEMNTKSLEQNTLGQSRFEAPANQEKELQVAESTVYFSGESCLGVKEDRDSNQNELTLLKELQTRIKAVERVAVEEIERLKGSSMTNMKLEAAMKEIAELKSRCWFDDKSQTSRMTKPESSELKIGILMKDIPLDQVGLSRRRGKGEIDDHQMLELWETAEDSSSIGPTVNETRPQDDDDDDIVYHHHQFEDSERKSDIFSLDLEGGGKELSVDKLEVSRSSVIIEPNQEWNQRKIVMRLASDTQKLMNLKYTVQDLRKKLETGKKRKNKNVDLETVKEQLQEVEETLVQVLDTNSKLMKNVEESSSRWSGEEIRATGNINRKRVMEQARKGSEKLGRLQLEVQKIQYLLLKFEEEKKSKGKKRFSRIRTSIVLRDLIPSRRRRSSSSSSDDRTRQDHRLCGCWKPSHSGDLNLYSAY